MNTPETYQVEVKPARKSGYYLQVENDNRTIVIHSRYHPDREARQWAEKFKETGQSDRVFLIGAGLGYFPRALREAGISCGVVEPLPELEFEGEIPLWEEQQYDDFMRIDATDNPIKSMAQLPAERLNNAQIIFHPGYEYFFSDPEEFIGSIQVMARGKLRNIQSKFRFMLEGFENLSKNLDHLDEAGSLTDMENTYHNQPGLLVGAGPSLTGSFPWLKKQQDRVLLLAVDSAYAPLKRAGISPDIILTMDPQPENSIHIENVPADTMLVASLTACPRYFRWAKKCPTAVFYLSEDREGTQPTFPAVEWFLDPLRPLGSLQSGGSVSSTGIDLLSRLGCNPIGIVGVDHAFIHNRVVPRGSNREQFFCSNLNRFRTLVGQHLNWIWELETKKGKQLKQTSSREGTTVLTMDEYEVQNRWFEHAVEVLSRELLDLRADGLPMEGWKVIEDPDSYLSEQCPGTVTRPVAAGDAVDDGCLRSGIQERAREGLAQFPDTSNEFMRLVTGETNTDDPAFDVFIKPFREYRSMRDSKEDVDYDDCFRRLRSLLEQLTESVD